MNEGDEEFVSEPLTPLAGTSDASAMSRGEPGLPAQFDWRGQRYEVAGILRMWKTCTPDRGELYLRRHWYTIRTTSGVEMTLYCERQTKTARRPKSRWYVYTVRRG